MALNDILKGAAILQENLRQMAVQNALKDANSAVQQIRSADMKDEEKRQKLQLVADAVVNRAAGLGVSGGTLNAVAKNIVPEAPKAAGTVAQAFIGGTETEKAGAKELLEFQAGLKKKSKDSPSAVKKQEQFTKSILKAQESINEGKGSFKKPQEAIAASQTLIDLIDNEQSVSDAAIRTFAARATGEVGNLTEAERAAFGGRQSILAKLQRWSALAATGKLPDPDRKELRALAGVLGDSATERMDQLAGQRAEQLSRVFKKDAGEIKNLILPRKQEEVQINPGAPQGNSMDDALDRIFKRGQ